LRHFNNYSEFWASAKEQLASMLFFAFFVKETFRARKGIFRMRDGRIFAFFTCFWFMLIHIDALWREDVLDFYSFLQH